MDVRLDIEKRRMVSYLVKVAIPKLVSSCFPQVSKEDLGGQMTQFWAQPGLGVPLPINTVEKDMTNNLEGLGGY